MLKMKIICLDLISPEFLLWALTPPGYFKNCILGVRVIKTKKLVGFILGIPVKMHVIILFNIKIKYKIKN